MKTLIALCSLLMVISARASISSNPNDAVDKFLQCLAKHNHSIPIQNAIFTPKNSSTFQQVLQAYIKNLRFLSLNTRKPVAIITALHESHIQATIICAKDNSLQIRIRSGGHDFEGLSYISDTAFVILDMFNLRSIDIDIASETAWVQSGAILGELYYEISKKSEVHAFPAGMCFEVGVGGHFSGGGYGNLMRKYGLSVDNVIDAQIVDYNGNIYDRKSMGEDLFWAIRGGGGASFGVIISWKIKLVRVPPSITVFKVSRTLELPAAAEIFYKWQQISTKINRELFIRAQLESPNPSETEKKIITITFRAEFLGQKSKLISLMKRKFPELGLRPEECLQVSWIESTVFWHKFPLGTPVEVMLSRTGLAKIFHKGKSDYVKEIIPKQDLEKIFEMFMKTERMTMAWIPYGGRMKEISDKETPFPHRKCLFNIVYWTVSPMEDGAETSNRRINLTSTMYDGMASYVTKGPRKSFFNFRDLDIGIINPSDETKFQGAQDYGFNYLENYFFRFPYMSENPSNETNFRGAQIYGLKYFRNNFIRLAKVKQRIDPHNFFKNEQSVPPLREDLLYTSI